jgi:hypothetical protein
MIQYDEYLNRLPLKRRMLSGKHHGVQAIAYKPFFVMGRYHDPYH